MSKKPELPPLDDDLKKPDKRLDLKAIRQKQSVDDAEIAENSQTLGNQWNASTSLVSVQNPVDTPTVARTPVASLRIEVPLYLDDELTQKAAAQRVTKQYLVLKALKQAGYHIAEADIVADKRKIRSKRG